MYSFRSQHARTACAGLLCLGVIGTQIQSGTYAAHASGSAVQAKVITGVSGSPALPAMAAGAHSLLVSAPIVTAAASVVSIEVRQHSGPSHIATGFVVRSDTTGTYIVTVARVLTGAKSTSVGVYASSNGKSYSVLGMALGGGKSGSTTDLAVLRLPPTTLKALSFGDSTKVHKGDMLTSIGIGATAHKPAARELAATSAIGLDLRDGAGAVWIQHQSALGANAAGGPLLDRKGLVEAINIKLVAARSKIQYYAVPSVLARTLITHLVTGLAAVHIPPAATSTPTASPTATNSPTPVPPTSTAVPANTATTQPTATTVPPTATVTATPTATPIPGFVSQDGYSLTLVPGWVKHIYLDGTLYFTSASGDVEMDPFESVGSGTLTDSQIQNVVGQYASSVSSRYGVNFSISFQHITIGAMTGLRGTLISGVISVYIDAVTDASHLVVVETFSNQSSSIVSIQQAAQIEQTIRPTN